MEGKRSIAEILQQEFYKRKFITGVDIDAEELFQSEKLKKWTKKLLESDETSELVRRIDGMSPERLAHAVATYLLGISIRESLNLNFDFLPRIFSKGSYGDAFYFFWSVICLCHDLGYQYENGNFDNVLMDTHEGRCSLLKIKYDLFEVDKDPHSWNGASEKEKKWILHVLELAKKYDKMRRSETDYVGDGPHIDHGIAGALILYDSLMKEYCSAARQKKNLSEVSRYRDPRLVADQEILSGEVSSNIHNSRFCICTILIACTVARHNMWNANMHTCKRYQKCGLDSLCQGKEDAIVSVEKSLDQMLFMLDFMDTIDPVKGIYTREAEKGADKQILASRCHLLLNNLEFEFKNAKSQSYRWETALKYQEFTISINTAENSENKRIFDEYVDGLKDLDSWLKTKAPHFQKDSEGVTSSVTCYYPNFPRKQRQWVGGITENEIIALCLYEGGGGSGKSSSFYQYHNAYQTLNLLMMDGLEGEEVRVCVEKQNPHGIYITEWQRTLEVMTDIFTAQCKFMEYWYREKENRPNVYRVDRKVNFDMMQNQGGTFAFTSTSQKGYLENIAKTKKDCILQEIVLTKNIPFIDYAELLQERYIYSEEQEVLLPPFLKLCKVEEVLDSESKELDAATNSDKANPKYVVKFGEVDICDGQEDEMELINCLEKYKHDAAEVLEEMKRSRNIDRNSEDTKHYLEWKKNFQMLVKRCFFSIGEAYGLNNC